MEEYLIDYIKALFKKDYQLASKISKDLEKSGMDKLTQNVLIMDKKLIEKARHEIVQELTLNK